MSFEVGDKVECYYDDGWYPGVIKCVNQDGTFYVDFDDGDTLSDAVKEEIRYPIAKSVAHAILPHAKTSNPLSTVDMAARTASAQQKPKAITMGMIISSVEKFLLPTVDESFKSLYSSVVNKDPSIRLDAVLCQVVVADNIRHLQSLHRDNEDELKLLKDIRSDPASLLSTKTLTVTITEGRARAIALCRLVHGEGTMEMLRAVADLANIYALQGMWAQVAEHMAVASQQLLNVAASKRLAPSVNRSRYARAMAAGLERILLILRHHAIQNFGQITDSIINDIVEPLEQFFNEMVGKNPEDSIGSVKGDSDFTDHVHALANSLGSYIARFRADRTAQGESSSVWPSWGNVLDYLRNECHVMKGWVSIMQELILPQNRAILRTAFQRVDVQGRGVVHPAGMSGSLRSLPSALKLVSSSQLCSKLEKMKVEVFIFIDPKSGMFCDPVKEGRQSVSYELPLSWEEFLVMYIIETENFDIDLLMIQVLNLVGLSQLFSGNVKAAEEVFEDALSHLRRIGMDNEYAAIDLYNSLSQLHVAKYRQWQVQRKAQCNEDAAMWMLSDDGQSALKQEMKKQRAVVGKNGQQVPKAKANEKAVNIVLAQRTKVLLKAQHEPNVEILNNAFRYLVQTFELTERFQGEFTIASGAACLAVASVQNILGSYEEARSWLVRAMRTMEKVQPRPIRAIAFIQLQLSSVLQKQNHIKECIQVLSSASTFYYESARKSLAELSRSQGFASLQGVSPEKTAPVFEEVNHSLELLQRLMVLNSNAGHAWQAVELAETAADLAEDTYGWDSEEAALNRCELGKRCAVIGDWIKAILSFRKSIESHEVLYGHMDKRTAIVGRLLHAAIDKQEKALAEQQATTN